MIQESKNTGSEIFAHAQIAFNAIRDAKARANFAIYHNGNLMLGGFRKGVNLSVYDAKEKYGNLLLNNDVEMLIFNDVCAKRLHAKNVHIS